MTIGIWNNILISDGNVISVYKNFFFNKKFNKRSVLLKEKVSLSSLLIVQHIICTIHKGPGVFLDSSSIFYASLGLLVHDF